MIYMDVIQPDTSEMVSLGSYCEGELECFYNEPNGDVFIIVKDSGCLLNNSIRFYDTIEKAKSYVEKALKGAGDA